MSKYDGLRAYLRGQFGSEVLVTFAEIEQAIGVKLPPKAQHHRAWWSNNPSNNVMTKIWLDAGFETAQVDIPGRKLVFKRLEKGQTDMSEEVREYKLEKVPVEKKSRRHPAFGALKGTFWIDPEWDLTKPTIGEEEMAEWDASLDRKAVLYEQGLSRKPR
ncbi:MAG TPA: hypothetical protein VHZ29_09855 [Rhizomicrobium sp.]|jgi:hypothetical protein|nr:hypothetical protein [Rhizomicrobium sp.]